jgi:GMP synthase (glutamine-hydrolysing)
MRHMTLPQWGLQFHPEVEHTEHGVELLGHFYQIVAELKADWFEDNAYEEL